MSGFIETSKVKSSNPDHAGGYFIKNTADLTPDDVLFDAPAKAPAAPVAEDADQFDAMNKAELKAFLTANDVTFHHAAGETKLRELARGVAASDELV